MADETPGGEQELNSDLDGVKNPFDDGIPKPVVQEPVQNTDTQPVETPKPKPVIYVPPVISLPELEIQGVIVGEGIHEAIIDDEVVPLDGTIKGKGVKLVTVTKQGIGLLYKGKKFFLKVD